MNDSLPTISVIIPLEDHRGLAEKAIRSWSHHQTLDRQQFELVLVADHADRVHDQILKSLCIPEDLLVYTPKTNFYGLFDAAAREAHGNILLFTELHVLADPGCLAALVEFFATQSYEVACCRGIDLSENFIAQMQERLLQETFDGPLRVEFWRAILARGLAIRKHLYIAEGGFQFQLENIAVVVMADA